MGSKKIIYILLTILLVGILIVAFYIKGKSPAEKNRDELSLILLTVTSDAQSYFQSHNSFEGWKIPQFLKVDKIGKVFEKGNEQELKIVALGNEIGMNEISKVKLEYIIRSSGTDLFVRN